MPLLNTLYREVVIAGTKIKKLAENSEAARHGFSENSSYLGRLKRVVRLI